MPPDYSPAGLGAAAGLDPWALARKVTDGRPDEVRTVGLAFRNAREQAVDVVRSGGVADRTTAAAHTNDGVEVWDAEAAGRRTRGLLSGGGDDLEDVARALTVVAEELTTTSAAVRRELDTLTAEVNGVIAHRNAALAGPGGRLPVDRSAADQRFFDEAVGLVRGCAQRVQGHLDAYDRVLVSRTGFLADLGYEGPSTGSDQRGSLVDRDATSTLPPELTVPEILRTPPGARLEGGLGPATNIAVPAPGGGVVLGTPPAPDLGTGHTDRGIFPFAVPDGSRVFTTGGTDKPAEPPVVHQGKQGKHTPGHPNFEPTRSVLTADAKELILRAGSGDQVGAVPVGQPGSRERIDFGKEIGVFRDKEGNPALTTVGIVHYGKTGAHIVPARPR